MPFYDIGCNACEEDFADVYASLESEPKCPVCKKEGRIKIHPVPTIGPMPSKPLHLGGAEKFLTTNEQVREYKRANPNARFVTKDSSEWRNHYDDVRNHCDNKAKKRGYRDMEDQLDKRKVEQKRASA